MKLFNCLLTMLALSVSLQGYGCSKKEVPPQGRGATQNQSPLSPTALEEQETSFKEYFPLNAGRSWTYLRTVKRSEGIRYYLLQKKTRPYKVKDKQTKSENHSAENFVVLTGMQGTYPTQSEETYNITGEREGIFWKVSVEGTKPRDGRYSPISVQPNIRWGYQGQAVNERTDGIWLSFDEGEYYSEDYRWAVVLVPNTVHSDPFRDPPRWAVAAKIAENEAVGVPVGTFKDCLKNITMIYGKNITGVLFRGVAPAYTSEDGYMVISYYAKGIGLVKEVQYDAEGRETYLLELKDYKK